jgi:8-oxo-dGTP pyrophosphatase MutT (NUDIX family)
MSDPIRAALASYTPKRIERDGLARAAVLIPVYEVDAVPHTILQVRTELVLHHKGQIAFPGGAVDEGDTDLAMTALRETEEEIGLQREDVEIIGRLDDLTTISDFVVTPFVGRVTKPAPYPFAPSGYEVAELLVVPIPHLHANRHDGPVRWRGRPVGPPSYGYGEHVIWGATARLLGQFLELTAQR